MKHRKHSDKFKAKAIALSIKLESIKDAAAKLSIHPSLLTKWRSLAPSAPVSKNSMEAPAVAERHMKRTCKACIGILRGVKKQVDVEDPVHLSAMLVLSMLEGRM